VDSRIDLFFLEHGLVTKCHPLIVMSSSAEGLFILANTAYALPSSRSERPSSLSASAN